MKRMKKIISAMVAAVLLFGTCSNTVLYAAEVADVLETTKNYFPDDNHADETDTYAFEENDAEDADVGNLSITTEEVYSECMSETAEESAYEEEYDTLLESEPEAKEEETLSESESKSETREEEATLENENRSASENETPSETKEEEETTSENESVSEIEEAQPEYQYIVFPSNDDIIYTVSDKEGVAAIEHAAPETIYAVSVIKKEEVVFEASVCYGYQLQIPQNLKGVISEQQERKLWNERWVYYYSIKTSQLFGTQDKPFVVQLERKRDEVLIEVSGNATVEGVGKDKTALFGSVVSIEVLTPGETLALISQDKKGNPVYTAMELNTENKYQFKAYDAQSFVVADPDKVDYFIANSSNRKAKLTGEAGLKLQSLASSAQGYREIVLNFTAISNGSDGTETEDTYYEIKVTAAPKKGETIPAGSGTTPKYHYVKKVENVNTQSQSIVVNKGDLSAPTACTYEFCVRLIHLSKQTNVPDINSPVEKPLNAVLSGNMLSKTFATKNLYYEDKIGFTKKNTKIYTGQENVFVGMVKYSKNASYLHDLTAVAYNAGGAVEDYITCTFQKDNDELYVSADSDTMPGKYTVVVYAGIGEEQTKDNPLGGTMYQANTSFTLTVEPGINYINAYATVKQVAVTSKKNGSFNVVSNGQSGRGLKAKQQKFTYEIKSANYIIGKGYETIEPTDKVKNNVSISKSGKVTIKKGYTVDAATGEDYIAVIVKAADFESNDTYTTAYVRILNTELVPTEIRLLDSNGNNLGTKFSADKTTSWSRLYVTAQVEVLDQFGNNMNSFVTITPTVPNKNSYNKNYVSHYAQSNRATLYICKLGTFSIKAVSTDGGKKSKTVKFTVTQQALEHELYSVQSVSYNGVPITDFDTADGRMTYSAPRGTVIKVYNGFEVNRHTHTNHNGDKKGCHPIYNRSWYDWDYEIKGGSVKFEGNLWVITPTERSATLTLWIKSQPKRKTHVTYTNLTWKDYDAAPKVTLKAGGQKIYSNKYSKYSDLEENGYYDEETGEWETYRYVSNQKVTYTYDSGSYDAVRITPVSSKTPYFWVSDFNKADKSFQINASAEDVKPGSYKYKVTFYKRSNNSYDMQNLQLAAQSALITIKVHKAPKIKISPSYTLKMDQADSVALKLAPNDFLPDFETKLLNANVNGKTNNFSDYFEVVTSRDSVGVSRVSLKLKSNLTTEQKNTLKEQKKIEGYIKYSYYYGNNHIKHATSKITIAIR